MSQTALEIQEPQSREVVNDAPRMAIADMTPVQMAYQLINSGADFASVKEMMTLSKELAADQAKRAFDKAIAAAKSKIPTITKNAKGHNSKSYANFAAYAAVVDPILGEYGLSYRFRTEQTDRITVTCILTHEGGHSEENSLSGPSDTSGNKNAIQAIGSTLTYLQRYTLIQALGLAASDDDDGRNHGRTDQQLRTITEDQQIALREMIEASGADEQRFLKFGNLEKLSDMRASDFDAAMAMLKKRMEQANG